MLLTYVLMSCYFYVVCAHLRSEWWQWEWPGLVHSPKTVPPVVIKAPVSSNYSDISLLGARCYRLRTTWMDAGGKWTVFHVDGTIIPEEDGWTLRRLLLTWRSRHRSSKLVLELLHMRYLLFVLILDLEAHDVLLQKFDEDWRVYWFGRQLCL